MSAASEILMIRPVAFGFNAQTAANNAFQNPKQARATANTAQQNALAEFDTFVEKLQAQGVVVHVIPDTIAPHTPDSIFPNNWISTHSNACIVTYPMYAPNRRAERRPDIQAYLEQHFAIHTHIDLTRHENQGHYLEGTGSMVLDYEQKIAYACLSERTHLPLLQQFGQLLGFQIVHFAATDQQAMPIYHTNVLMCIAKKYAVVCLDVVRNPTEKAYLQQKFENTGKTIVTISYQQMERFAGNMLELSNASGSSLLVMSSSAYNSLTSQQLSVIQSFSEIVHSDLSTIESLGGGSARCMIAEILLPKS
jgi:hypothetical protein